MKIAQIRKSKITLKKTGYEKGYDTGEEIGEERGE